MHSLTSAPSLCTQNKLISLQGTPRDCQDIALGQYSSGSYVIRPRYDLSNLRVYCDMDTDNGGLSSNADLMVRLVSTVDGKSMKKDSAAQMVNIGWD